MPHCQICFHEVPQHAPDCPVATGEPVHGGQPALQQAQGYHGQLMERLRQSQEQIGVRGSPDDHMRIEALEKELALLRARVAKLERAGGDAY